MQLKGEHEADLPPSLPTWSDSINININININIIDPSSVYMC